MIGNVMSCQARRPALIVAVSAAAFALAACGSSTPAKPAASSASSTPAASSPSTPAPPPPAPTPAKVRAQGTVNTVTGSTLGLGAAQGPTTVVIAPSTKITQISPAQLTDVTTGSCVDVKQAAAAPGAPAAPARSITVTAASHGKCTQDSGPKGLSGTVTAVDGQTVSVAISAAPPIAVPVDKKTKFLTENASTALVITHGACLSATGTLDPTGALAATAATVGPPAKAKCPGS